MRYYDLLSHTEVSSETRGSEKRVIGLAKQKLILYLAFVKQIEPKKVYDVQAFLDVYYNQQILDQALTQERREHARAAAQKMQKK